MANQGFPGRGTHLGDRSRAPAPQAQTDVLVGTIRKAAGNEVRVQVREFEGHQFADIRLFTPREGGDALPTAKGVTIPPARLGELIELLQRAEAMFEGGAR